MEFVPNEKATPIRYPSTANLMVDSADRAEYVYPSCADFLITKNQSMMNGFFTRVGTTEVVFEWNTPNIGNPLYDPQFPNTGAEGTIVFYIGTIRNTFVLQGFFTVADLMNAIAAGCNEFTTTPATGTATGVTVAVNALEGAGAEFVLTGAASGVVWNIQGPPIGKLQINENRFDTISGMFGDAGAGRSTFPILAANVDLRTTRYLDIVCNQLTNNQAVKDGSTAANPRDVLCRWYFDYDGQNPTDAYGFPILMGYAPFYLRRIFNPPKQIQWQTNVPIGQMAFQLYNDKGIIPTLNNVTNYLMTLQASEV